MSFSRLRLLPLLRNQLKASYFHRQPFSIRLLIEDSRRHQMKEPAHFSPDKGIFLRMPEGNLIARGTNRRSSRASKRRSRTAANRIPTAFSITKMICSMSHDPSFSSLSFRYCLTSVPPGLPDGFLHNPDHQIHSFLITHGDTDDHGKIPS